MDNWIIFKTKNSGEETMLTTKTQRPKKKVVRVAKDVRLFDFFVVDDAGDKLCSTKSSPSVATTVVADHRCGQEDDEEEEDEDNNDDRSEKWLLRGADEDMDAYMFRVEVERRKKQQQREKERWLSRRRRFLVQLFGMDEYGKTCSILVTDFRPFFYVKLPAAYEPSRSTAVPWTNGRAELIALGFWLLKRTTQPGSNMEFRVATQEEADAARARDPVYERFDLVVALEYHHKLYGFDNGMRHMFLRLEFEDQRTMQSVRRLFYPVPAAAAAGATKPGDRPRGELRPLLYQPRGAPPGAWVSLEIYESGIPPLLRFFHLRNISPSGWIRLQDAKNKEMSVERRHTTCDYEFVCRYADLQSLAEKEDRVPFKICSFDIEASSSHGDFPIPQKTYKRFASQFVDFLSSGFEEERAAGATGTQSDRARPELARNLLESALRTALGLPSAHVVSEVEHVFLKNPELFTEKEFEEAFVRLMAYEYDFSRGGVEVTMGIEDAFRTAAMDNMDMDVPDEEDGGASSEDDAAGVAGVNDDGDGEDSRAPLLATAAAAARGRQARIRPKLAALAASVAAAKPKKNIVDILLDRTGAFSRDDKINLLNDLLSYGGVHRGGDDDDNMDVDVDGGRGRAAEMGFYGFPPVEGDKVTFIGSTFMYYGCSEPDPSRCYCGVLDTCDSVPGAQIVCVESERDLLLWWTRLICEENPDIIIGYNIFGFDYEFMFRRAQELGCETEFLTISRHRGRCCGNTAFGPASMSETSPRIVGIENSKVVLASGEYDLHYIKMPGRLQIDLYTYLRRDYNLASYKLDDVSGQFIGDEIAAVEIEESVGAAGEAWTWLTTFNVTGLHVGDFIHLEESGFTTDYYADGTKFQVLRMERLPPLESDKDKKERVRVAVAGRHRLASDKTLRWGLAKDDVSPQDIFRMTREGPAARAVVAKYCIQDCNLVHHLLNKIDLLTSYSEMARICSVPMSFLVFRGQGIKLTSYVAKKCREKNTLMPDLDKAGGNEGYEGAIVLPPKCKMYMDEPVACVDYASLYPSVMISENLSHDSKVWTREYDLEGREIPGRRTGDERFDHLPGVKYVDIEFDLYRTVVPRPGAAAQKVKSGTKKCRWAQFPDGQKGIMPSILQELLRARAETRKKAKTETDPFMCNILEKRQLGYKVTANSLYGQCGARTSTFYEKDIAASTTATGRKMITYAKRVIEEVYGDDTRVDTAAHGPVLTSAEYVYGDSVAAYTPVLLRLRSTLTSEGGPSPTVFLEPVDRVVELFSEGRAWQAYGSGAAMKEICRLNVDPGMVLETWTEKGWTPIQNIIRHRLADHKKMLRVVTSRGIVDVTSDHSLLTPAGEEVRAEVSRRRGREAEGFMRPCDDGYVRVGDLLMASTPPPPDHLGDNITLIQARLLGFHAICARSNPFMDTKFVRSPAEMCTQWTWVHPSMNLLTFYCDLWRQTQGDCQKVEMSDISEYLCGSELLHRCQANARHPDKEIRTWMLPTRKKELLRVPYCVLRSGSVDVQRAFVCGVMDGLIGGSGTQLEGVSGFYSLPLMFRLTLRDQLFSAQMYYLLRVCMKISRVHLWWSSSRHRYLLDVSDTPCCVGGKPSADHGENAAVILDIFRIPYYGYVYDFTTENHHFSAGAGELVVHNTDSVFFTFNLKDAATGEDIRGKKALEVTIEIAQEVASMCTKFLKTPMELTYEKTLMPFVLLSKKRYVGMLYETDPKKGKLKYMGLSIKRRDSCDYLKDVYGGIIKKLMASESLGTILDYLEKSLSELVNGKVPMEKLTITRALRSDYKNPAQIAHRVLADRIAKRDPGNKPKPGDRMKFLFIQALGNTNSRRALLGDRVETPEFIVANPDICHIDYNYYVTNQLMKPLQQLFGLAVFDIYRRRHGPNSEMERRFRAVIDRLEVEVLGPGGVRGLSGGSVVHSQLEVFMKKREMVCSREVKKLLFDATLRDIQNRVNRQPTIHRGFGGGALAISPRGPSGSFSSHGSPKNKTTDSLVQQSIESHFTLLSARVPKKQIKAKVKSEAPSAAASEKKQRKPRAPKKSAVTAPTPPTPPTPPLALPLPSTLPPPPPVVVESGPAPPLPKKRRIKASEPDPVPYHPIK